MIVFRDGWYRLEGDRGFEVFRHEYSTPLPFEIRPGDAVVDLGANVGVFSRLAFESGASVLSVEPVPEVFAVLKLNCPKCDCRMMAAYDLDNVTIGIEYDLSDTGKSSSVLPVEGKSCQTSTVTVDGFNLDRLTVIKMDIEGCEERALRGAMETIRAFRPRMLVSIEHLPDDESRLSAVIDAIQPGYRKTVLPSRGPGDRTLYCEWRGR
jgi:FkbM family methyltransferase